MLLPSTTGTTPLTASTTKPTRVPAAPGPSSEAHVEPAHGADTPAPHEVEQAVKTLNEFTAMTAQDVRFSVDEESGKTVIKVVDTATEEVLRQFPSAEALSIARSIDRMQGLLIREKA